MLRTSAVQPRVEAISAGGRLLPAVLKTLDVIRQYDLVLAMGHSTPAETMMLIKEARKRGITRIVVTHAMLIPVTMTVDQMKQAAALGAYIEFAYNGLIGANRQFSLPQYSEAIRRVGPEHCIVSSDLGQTGNPLPVAGLRTFLEGLRAQGFSEGEIRRMAVQNPADLLDGGAK